jgi:hypothetical protein
MWPSSMYSLCTQAFLPISIIFVAVTGFGAAQDSCVLNTAITTVLIYENPIYINTKVLYNTTFEVNSDFTVTVSNAPTSFHEITTYTATSTIVGPPTFSGASKTSAPTGLSTSAILDASKPFVLVLSGGASQFGKRQSSVLLVGNGRLTSSCVTATSFSLTADGELFSTYNGVTLQYSAAFGAPYAPFVPSSSVGTYTGYFSLGAGNTIGWFNDNFFNGNALFCAFNNGTILAVFEQDAQPSGCLFIQLTISQRELPPPVFSRV